MLLFAWMVMGIVTAYVGSWVLNDSGAGLLLDLALGAAGGIIGGFVHHTWGAAGPAANVYSLGTSALAAIVVLLIHHRMPKQTVSR